MVTVEATTLNGERSRRAGTFIGGRAGRRDSLEAIGLLLGILFVLLVVVVTMGVAPVG